MNQNNPGKEITRDEIDRLYIKIKNDAESSGYHLNPDEQFTKDLIKGLLINQSRYGYMSCPCRLSEGQREKDRDIICPCDYRDADLNDYDACYCALYVSGNILSGAKKLAPIPERRYKKDADAAKNPEKSKNKHTLPDKIAGQKKKSDLKFPVWRCRVCGYLCARENPPEACPICKANKDRFEIFF